MTRRARALSVSGFMVAGAIVCWSQMRPAVRAQGTESSVVVGRAVSFAVTEPLGIIAARNANRTRPLRPEPIYRVPNKMLPKVVGASAFGTDVDAALDNQVGINGANLPPPILTFEGLSNSQNGPLVGGFVYPPDTVGDVGPNHYVQQVNLILRVFNKAGTALAPAMPLSDLFPSGPCSLADDGDPIVLYDSLADRWLLSQFNLPSFPNPPYYECIAISQTPDPTGPYYAYTFMTPGANMPDYPKIGVWPNGYFMSVNQFLNAGPFNGTGVYAFDRARMLAGDPGATFIYRDLSTVDPGIGGTLPSDLDGPPSAAGRPNVFAMFTASEFGDPGGDGLRLWEFTPNFTSPAASTFTELPAMPVAAFDPITPPGSANIPQPGTAVRLDAIGDRLLHRLQYRNFGTYESLVVNHTVDVSGDPSALVYRAGVRWYELRRSLPGGAWIIQNQASYGPADTVNRWMGSAAMDNGGNLAVGFSVSDATSVFPGIRYAGRLAGDAANSLVQGEETLQIGSGFQTGSANRWGDYSALTVDPADDCTFWYTQEYYSNTPPPGAPASISWQTRVGSFKFVPCTSQVPGRITGTVMNGDTATPFVGARISVGGIFYGVTAAGGTYSIPVLAGTYTISATAPLYSTDSAGGIIVTSTGSTAVPTLTINTTAGTLQGTVFNGNTGMPFVGAAVSIDGSFVGDTSGSGQYSFLIAAGPHTVSATAPDFSTDSAAVNVTVGGTTTQNLTIFSRTVTFTNSAPITIPDSGNGSPYPSTINVTGMKGTVQAISVRLNGLTHTFPSDLDLVLVSPGGQALAFMSDLGGGTDVSGITLTFSDTAASLPPATLVTGFVKPSNIGTGDNFPPPGPGLIYANPAPAGSATLVSTFGDRNPNGVWSLYLVDDAGQDLGSIAGGWSIKFEMSNSPGDFDGDGMTDWAVTRTGSIIWHILNSVGYTAVVFGDDSEDIRVPGDYDGDGKTDVAVWRPSNATFYIRRSIDGAVYHQPWGASGDDPRIVGDYDGDGKHDFAVYRAGAQSLWLVRKSSDGTLLSVPFGQTGDKPAPGDYDGDRKADFAVLRGPGAALFYVLQSTAGFFSAQWGLGTDAVLSGDYDGDGKSDIAVARNVGGAWNHYVRLSSNGSLYAQVFGSATDILTPGDYDGDGVTDVAVWRGSPAPSTFYALKSSNYQLLAQPWGVAGDYPVPFFIVH